jgi:hypothetical protein
MVDQFSISPKLIFMKRIIAAVLSLVFISTFAPAMAADTISITESSDYTAVVDGVGQVWKGKIPTKIAFPAGTSSQKLEFQIQGILPQSILGNRATGTDVEFEIWSDAGKKIGSDTVYSFDWNPVGPNTLVSMYLYESEAIGTHTMIVRTIYELSTTGLLTRYIKTEQRFTIKIVSAVKPPQVDLTSASIFSESAGYSVGTKYQFTPVTSVAISNYEVGLMILKSPGLDATKTSNYFDPIVFKSVSSGSFELRFDDLKPTLLKYMSDFSNSAFLIKVRAVSEGGTGDWGKGYYTETKEIQSAEATKASLAAKAEFEKQDRISRCSITNQAIIDLSKLAESYFMKYPSNAVFGSIKSSIPAPLNCSNAADPSMASVISAQDLKISSLDTQLTSAMQLADNPPPPPVKKVTITCIKGKVSKKVTGTAPKCPAGYKKK